MTSEIPIASAYHAGIAPTKHYLITNDLLLRIAN